MQILGKHQQANILHWPVDMQVSRPPAFFFHVHETVHCDQLIVGGVGLDNEIATSHSVLSTTLHLEGVIPGSELEFHPAVEDEVVIPGGMPGWLDRSALLVLQVHADRYRLSGILVGDTDFHHAAGGCQQGLGC